jgi:hypothetical protein
MRLTRIILVTTNFHVLNHTLHMRLTHRHMCQSHVPVSCSLPTQIIIEHQTHLQYKVSVLYKTLEDSFNKTTMYWILQSNKRKQNTSITKIIWSFIKNGENQKSTWQIIVLIYRYREDLQKWNHSKIHFLAITY